MTRTPYRSEGTMAVTPFRLTFRPFQFSPSKSMHRPLDDVAYQMRPSGVTTIPRYPEPVRNRRARRPRRPSAWRSRHHEASRASVRCRRRSAVLPCGRAAGAPGRPRPPIRAWPWKREGAGNSRLRRPIARVFRDDPSGIRRRFREPVPRSAEKTSPRIRSSTRHRGRGAEGSVRAGDDPRIPS